MKIDENDEMDHGEKSFDQIFHIIENTGRWWERTDGESEDEKQPFQDWKGDRKKWPSHQYEYDVEKDITAIIIWDDCLQVWCGYLNVPFPIPQWNPDVHGGRINYLGAYLDHCCVYGINTTDVHHNFIPPYPFASKGQKFMTFTDMQTELSNLARKYVCDLSCYRDLLNLQNSNIPK